MNSYESDLLFFHGEFYERFVVLKSGLVSYFAIYMSHYFVTLRDVSQK